VASFTTNYFIPRERALGTHWKEGWAGPRDSLDTVAKRKKSLHLPSGIKAWSSRLKLSPYTD